ncbi:MAG: hypothetical protein Q9170_000425 [Blastenia crenularia]
MGNQNSTVRRNKPGLPANEGTSPSSPGLEEDLSRQETIRPSSTIRKRLPKFRHSSSRASPLPFVASSGSAQDAASITSRKQIKGIDGASTPNNEPVNLTLPAPSMMTDAQYMALSLDTVAPSETSTITQRDFGAAGSLPQTPTPTPSVSSELRSPSQPVSTPGSLRFRPHPYFPTRPVHLDRIPAPPLTPIHFACYQSHRRMLNAKNTHHPVPCMTCGVSDEHVRWKCVWCCLRVCDGCMEGLKKIEGRDLSALVRNVKGKTKQVDTSEQEGRTSSNAKGKEAFPKDAVAVGRKIQRESS